MCQFSDEDLKEAIEIAKVKSQFTMNVDQNGISRNNVKKFNNQLQGILAEIAVETLLKEMDLNPIRYDKIRTDGFRSAKGEFDLKFKIQDKEFLVESRSSKFYNLNQIIDHPIIGSYKNQFKRQEKENDLFFKTLFFIKDKKKSLIENISEKKTFILTGGAFLEDFKNNGYVGNLGQSNTQYNLLKIEKQNQMDIFIERLLLFKKQELDMKNKNFNKISKLKNSF